MVPLLAYNYAAKNFKRMNEVFAFGRIVFNIPILLLLHVLFGVMGIVRTQFGADTLTVIVSYLIYMRIEKQEGF